MRLTLYIAISSTEEVRRAEQLADDLTEASPLQKGSQPQAVVVPPILSST
jgi:hypothetical protein